MSVTLNPTANQNPFSSASWNQSNAASSSVNASSTIGQISTSTENTITYSGAMSATQSSQAACYFNVGVADYYSDGTGPVVLFTDTSNLAYVTWTRNMTNDNWAMLRTIVSGSSVDTNFATGLADSWMTDGDVIKLDVTWSGADAIFKLYQNGAQVGSTLTKTSFGLTSGKPGFLSRQNGSSRQLRCGTLVITGEDVGSGIVSIKGNLGPRVALGSARVGF